MRAFAELGIEVRSFRPPGGVLSERSPALLREAGIGYVSPAGATFGIRDGLVYVPFEWRLVDAYRLMERFRGLRERLGDSPQPADPELLAERFCEELSAPSGPKLRQSGRNPASTPAISAELPEFGNPS